MAYLDFGLEMKNRYISVHILTYKLFTHFSSITRILECETISLAQKHSAHGERETKTWNITFHSLILSMTIYKSLTETKGLNVLNWSDHFTLSFPEIGFDKIERLLSFFYFTVRTLIFIVYSFFFETIVDISYKSHKPHFSMLLSGFVYNKNRKKQLN